MTDGRNLHCNDVGTNSNHECDASTNTSDTKERKRNRARKGKESSMMQALEISGKFFAFFSFFFF